LISGGTRRRPAVTEEARLSDGFPVEPELIYAVDKARSYHNNNYIKIIIIILKKNLKKKKKKKKEDKLQNCP